MIAATVVLLLAPKNGQAYIDACIASGRDLSAYSVHIETNTIVPGKHERLFLDYRTSSNRTFLHLREPGHDGQAGSDRSFLLEPDQLIGYDAAANESIKRPFAGKDSSTDRLTALLGQLPDALRMVITPTFQKSFLSQFRGTSDWKISKEGPVTSLFRKVGQSQTRFRFEGPKSLLKSVEIKLLHSSLNWSFEYHPTRTPSLHIPSDAIPVSSFTVQSAPPTYKSPVAKQVVDAMVQSYRTLQAGVIEVENGDHPERNCKLTIGARWLREDRSTFSWAYDGTNLTILDRKTNRYYQGPAVRALIAEYIVKVGCEVDPIVPRLLQRRAPYSDLLVPQATVSHKGVIGSGDTSSDIIQVSGGNPQASLFIRQDNHLVDSIELEVVDRGGRILARSTEQFHYSGIGKMPRAIAFKIEPGSAKVLPLPEIQKSN